MAYYLEDGQFVDVYQYNDFTYNINDYTIIGYYDDEWNVLPEYEDIKILAAVTYSLINGHLLYYNVEYNTDDNTLHIPEGTEYIDCQVNYSGWGSDEITTKVIIPETVKEIGDNAFKDFSALKSINIPEGVTRIGDSAFSGCGSLAAVELPDALTEIGENAFAYTALTSIEIPENVEEIGREAFARCESLANVTFKGNKLRNIYYGTFEDCPIEELVLPDGLEMIEHNNFYETPKSITFPDSILNTNQYVFNTTEWYKAIPDDEPVCAGRCFLGFKTEHTFDTFTLPEGTKAIGSMSNVKADHVIIPDGVEYIAEEAFAYTNYKTVTFPDSVRYIGDGCFKKDRDNDRLEKVVFPKEVDYFGSDMFSYTTGSTLQLVDYSRPDHQLTVVLPQNLTEIPDNTFLNRTALFDITIPSSVKRIGKGAFSGCAWLESVVIPEGVEIIDGGESWSSLPGNIVIDYDWDGNVSLVLQSWLTEGAFGNCSSLTSVKLPNSLKILGSSTFCNSAIKSIDLKNVNYIGSQCFSLSKLEELRIPDTVQCLEIDNYGQGIAEYCIYLKKVMISEGIKDMKFDIHFNKCIKLNNITVPDELICAEIKSYDTVHGKFMTSFYDLESSEWYKAQPNGPIYLGNCLVGFKGEMPANYTLTVRDGTTSVDGLAAQPNLVAVKLPSSMKIISGAAFADCENLKEIDLGGAVIIGERAFTRCPLTSVKLPDNCKYVGSSAFYNIPLAKDGLNEGLRYIGSGNFAGEDVIVPATVSTIGNIAAMQGQPMYIWGYDNYNYPYIDYYPGVFGDGYYDNEETQKMENHTIRGYAGSAAQFYAEQGGYNFVSLGEMPDAGYDLYTFITPNISWVKNSGKMANMEIYRSSDDHLTFENFRSVEIDGNTVDPDNYIVTVGGLILKLKPEYLDTLAEGRHTVKVSFTDGEAETTLTVKASVDTQDNTFLLGDVNFDGIVNVTDISLAAAHVKALKPLNSDALRAGDINGDGTVNVTDISRIAAHVKGVKVLE